MTIFMGTSLFAGVAFYLFFYFKSSHSQKPNSLPHYPEVRPTSTSLHIDMVNIALVNIHVTKYLIHPSCLPR